MLSPTAPSPTDSTLASLLPDLGDAASDTASQRSSMQQPRVPSRQLLQAALDLAQRAVEMDKGNDVAGALAAYRDAVTKLRVVMERVGVEPNGDARRPNRNEEEGRTLRGIYDAYMARITLLSAYETSGEADGAAAGMSKLSLDVNGDATATPSSSTRPSSSGTPATATNGLSDAQSASEAVSPTTPMRATTSSAGAAAAAAGAKAAVSPIDKRRKRQPPGSQGKSFGLDDEADLSGVDGVDDPDKLPGLRTVRRLSTKTGGEGGSARNSLDLGQHPLPPLPPAVLPTITGDFTGDGVVSNGKAGDLNGNVLVSSTTAQGTISQRRSVPGSLATTDIVPPSPAPSSVQTFDDNSSKRTRTKSTYGSTNGDDGSLAIEPMHEVMRATLAPPKRLQGSAFLTPTPEPQPSEAMHRPFHLLRALYASMDPAGPGAYITSAIHVDPAVWKPSNWRISNSSSRSSGQPKLIGQEAKSRVIESLLSHLEAIRNTGAVLLQGPREERPSSASTLSKSQIDVVTRAGDELSSVLDALDDELDSTHKTLQSKGVAVGAWKGKNKSSWGSRLSARVDKMGRGGDSPDRYVDLLGQLFFAAQIIDEHLHCFTGPATPAYRALPEKTFKGIEQRVMRAAHFVGVVVVPFVLDDFKLFMTGYLKGGLRYLDD